VVLSNEVMSTMVKVKAFSEKHNSTAKSGDFDCEDLFDVECGDFFGLSTRNVFFQNSNFDFGKRHFW